MTIAKPGSREAMLIAATRKIEVYRRQLRRLRRELKRITADLRLERKIQRSILATMAQPEPAILPSRLTPGFGYEVEPMKRPKARKPATKRSRRKPATTAKRSKSAKPATQDNDTIAARQSQDVDDQLSAIGDDDDDPFAETDSDADNDDDDPIGLSAETDDQDNDGDPDDDGDAAIVGDEQSASAGRSHRASLARAR